VVVVAAAFLPLILKLIGAGKPTAAAALPYRKKDCLRGRVLSSQQSAKLGEMKTTRSFDKLRMTTGEVDCPSVRPYR